MIEDLLEDVWTVAWKELREIVARQGGSLGQLRRVFFAPLVVGAFFAWRFGTDWLVSLWPAVTAVFLPLFFGTSVVCDAFAGERERHTLETLLATRLSDAGIFFGKALALVVYSLGLVATAMLSALIAANLLEFGSWSFYSPIALGSALGAGLLSALLLTGAGFLVSVDATSVQQAQQRLSTGVILLWLVPFLIYRLLPGGLEKIVNRFEPETIALAGVAVLFVLSTLLMSAGARRFRRSRLLGDPGASGP